MQVVKKNILFFLLFTTAMLKLQAQQLPPLPDSVQVMIDTATNIEIKAEALLLAGDIYYALYTTDGYNKAVEYYNKALKVAINGKSKSYEAYTYKALGGVYDALNGEYLPKALEYYKKYNELFLTDKSDTSSITGGYLLQANVLEKMGKKEECQRTINDALAVFNNNPRFERGMNVVLITGAFYMCQLNDYAASKQYFIRLTKDSSFFKNQDFPLRKYYLQTRMYHAKVETDYTTALNFGKIVLQEATNKSDSMEILSQLAPLAEKAGQHQRAYQFLKMEFNLYREIVKVESLKSTDNNLLKSEIILKDENAKLLEKQKKLQQQFNYWLLAGLALTLVLATLLFRFAAQRRKQNKILKIQNEEKAILLGEIHHRVKNNLEMLQSMLLLQMREYKDDENVQTALGEANNRIQSIALLHKQLYSGNLASTSANLYFTEMFERILNEVNSRRHPPISYNVQVDDTLLTADAILPLALLVNEWITNSVKYAFAPGQYNAIIQMVLNNKSGQLHIAYNDNGSGETKIKTVGTGFGSRLISSLVKQLKGELNVNKTSDGWQYNLTLPLTK